jgi:hypothetical protein
MKININITNLVTIMLIYTLWTCEREKTQELIQKCLKNATIETCSSIYKGF